MTIELEDYAKKKFKVDKLNFTTEEAEADFEEVVHMPVVGWIDFGNKNPLKQNEKGTWHFTDVILKGKAGYYIYYCDCEMNTGEIGFAEKTHDYSTAHAIKKHLPPEVKRFLVLQKLEQS